jgi:hydrogenase maturation protease
MTAPLLVFGWGNASRGDDALGPLFVQQLSALAAAAMGNEVEFLEDYQLQVEHALDLVSRERVLFVDASLSCDSPFEVTTLRAARDASFSTHAMSPEAVMQVYRDLYTVHAAGDSRRAFRARRAARRRGAWPCGAGVDLGAELDGRQSGDGPAAYRHGPRLRGRWVVTAGQ